MSIYRFLHNQNLLRLVLFYQRGKSPKSSRCLRFFSIECPLNVHRISIETMDIRWRCDGDAMEMLRRNIEGCSECMLTKMVDSFCLYLYIGLTSFCFIYKLS